MILEQSRSEAIASGSNVISLQLRIAPRHVALLDRWLAAGGCMGLSDAMAYPPSRGGPSTDHVLVWVRENPDPAYLVAPDGIGWYVTDCLRDVVLTRVRSFEAALHFIRPALPVNVAA